VPILSDTKDKIRNIAKSIGHKSRVEGYFRETLLERWKGCAAPINAGL
jgi:hypothetical protein